MGETLTSKVTQTQGISGVGNLVEQEYCVPRYTDPRGPKLYSGTSPYLPQDLRHRFHNPRANNMDDAAVQEWDHDQYWHIKRQRQRALH